MPFTVATRHLPLEEQATQAIEVNLSCSVSTKLRSTVTVSTSHKAQTIGTTRHLYALRPQVHSASYRPGRVTTNQDMNFLCSHSHEARVGPIDSSDDWFPMQPSRLGSGLEAFSHNPYGGSITALSDRTTVDTRDHTWVFLSYYPRLL